MNRDLIKQAFPNQPRMQAAFESLVADAEAATARVQTALAAISGLSDEAEDIVTALAAKQPKNATLDAVANIGPDPGVLEQVQPGIVAIRAIDTDDTEALMSRRVADTRYLGASHSALTADRLTTARNIAISGDGSWSVSFDGSGNVTSALTLATVNANVGSFGSATQVATFTVNAKGLTTAAANVTIAIPSTQVTDFTEAAQDATGAMVDASLVYVDATPLLTRAALTGDATASQGSNALTLATVNSNVGSFGSATQAATFTVNGKGLTTAASNVTITPAVGSITGLGTGVATALAVNVGSAGAFVTFNGALGTPSSGTLTNCTFPTLNQNTTGSAAKWTTARLLAGNSVDGSANVAFANKVIVQGTVDAGLSAAQFLGALGTGIVKNTTTTGVLSIAVAADFPTLNQNTTGSAATLTTSHNIDGQAFNGSADITVIAPGTHAATSKATPVDADELPLVDSAASNVLKKLTWANLKATLKTYLDTLYQPLASALTSWAAVSRASGFDTFTATPTSANLRALITDETGTGSAVFSASPTHTGVVVVATDGSNGYFWSTGNANSGSGVGTFMCYDGTGGRMGAIDWSGTVRKPFGFYGSSFTINIGTGGATTAVVTFDTTFGNYANDAAAATGGVPVGSVYRNGSNLMVRVT